MRPAFRGRDHSSRSGLSSLPVAPCASNGCGIKQPRSVHTEDLETPSPPHQVFRGARGLSGPLLMRRQGPGAPRTKATEGNYAPERLGRESPEPHAEVAPRRQQTKLANEARCAAGAEHARARGVQGPGRRGRACLELPAVPKAARAPGGAWLTILNDGDWKTVLGGRKEAQRLLGGVVTEAVPAGQSERRVSAGHTGGEDAQAAVTFSLGSSCLDSDRPGCMGLRMKEKLRGGGLSAGPQVGGGGAFLKPKEPSVRPATPLSPSDLSDT